MGKKTTDVYNEGLRELAGVVTPESIFADMLEAVGLNSKEHIRIMTTVLFVVLCLSLLVLTRQMLRPRGQGKGVPMWCWVLLIPIQCTLVFRLLPAVAERTLNGRVDGFGAPPLSVAAYKEFQALDFVVDTHADTMLWGRDINIESFSGHVDVPRMQKGNVAMQGFTIVTGVPKNMNMERNDAPSNLLSDSVTLLAIGNLWPVKAITSRAERVIFQAERLRNFAAESKGKLRVVETKGQFKEYLSDRERLGNLPPSRWNERLTSGFLGIEGLHALDGDFANVERFVKAGIRMMGPSHFFDNEVGGSAAGVVQGGLTPFGEKVIQALFDHSVIVDLAHASKKVVSEVVERALAHPSKPALLNSHTGVDAICPSERNTIDAELKGVAKTGGATCIAYFKPAVCGQGTFQTEVASIVESIAHAVRVAGVDHVCLGSDFDGAVSTPFDVSGVVYVYEGLREKGFSNEDLQKISGGNVRRVLAQMLPE